MRVLGVCRRRVVVLCGLLVFGGLLCAGAYAASSIYSKDGLAKAKAGIKPYLKPTPIPVKERLAKRPPKGSKVVFINCGTPECQTFVPGLKAAAKALSVKFVSVVSGTSAQGIESAFESAAQLKPLAIIDPAFDRSLWRQADKQLQKQGIPVVGHAVAQRAGEGGTYAGTIMSPQSLDRTARIQADYVYTRTGNKTNAVYLNTLEFAVARNNKTAFINELKRVCPSCKSDALSVPAATLGTTAPAAIVSYLQAHPKVNWVVGGLPSQVFGLPPALKAAGLKVHIITEAGLPQNFRYMKDGVQDADIGFDYGQDTWLMMDVAARVGTHQKISPREQGAMTSQQILTRKQMTFDVSKPWVAIPTYQAYFKKLWGVSK
jgi:ribose transport system substrate-binding protein